MADTNNAGGNNGNKNNKGGTVFIVIFIIIFAVLYFVSCGDTGSSSSKKHDMDYYDRSDGKRIWYYTK